MSEFVEQVIDLGNGQVKIDFKKTDGTYTLQDAIYFSKEQYDSMTETDIEAEKTRRFENWLAIITAPPVETPIEPTPQLVDTIEIAGETYQKLEGVPVSGAKLIEANGIWYYKV